MWHGHNEHFCCCAVGRPGILSRVFHCSLSWLAAMQNRLPGLPVWSAGKLAAQLLPLTKHTCLSVAHDLVTTVWSQTGWSSRRSFRLRAARVSRGLERVFTQFDKIRISSRLVRARRGTSAGCHRVWFEMHDHNSRDVCSLKPHRLFAEVFTDHALVYDTCLPPHAHEWSRKSWALVLSVVGS